MNLENVGSCRHDKVLIVQTFGRGTGFIAASCRIADPDRSLPLLILLPEDQRSAADVMGAIDDMVSSRNRCLVVISEGYVLGELGGRTDLSGQVMYGSSSSTAAQNLTNLCMDNGIQARFFIPSIDQRSDGLFAGRRDLDVSCLLGEHAVKILHEGRQSLLVAPQAGWKIGQVPFSGAGDLSRTMPSEWVEKGNFDASDQYIDYLNTIDDDPIGIDPSLSARWKSGSTWMGV